jgi:hypothetical protein
MRRLRPLSEQECYLRCYSWRRSDHTVRVVSARPAGDTPLPSARAERIRLLFAAALDAREPEAA